MNPSFQEVLKSARDRFVEKRRADGIDVLVDFTDNLLLTGELEQADAFMGELAMNKDIPRAGLLGVVVIAIPWKARLGAGYQALLEASDSAHCLFLNPDM